jgi:hypothetical protein
MFIGHFALGFASKRAAPALSLGTAFLSCQLLDLLWPDFLLLGVEKVNIDPGNTAFTPLDFETYPYTHSLVAAAGWAVVLGLGLALFRGARQAATAAALVVSHWLLDYITHRPDLPITIGGPERYGLGLWNSVPATLLVEGALFAAGLTIYIRSTEATGRPGGIGLWLLVAFLVVVYVVAFAGPPPPDPAAVAWTGQSMWLIVAWGYWVDRHRRMRGGRGSSARPDPPAAPGSRTR